MRLTTKGRFAVTAMIDLALRHHSGPVTLAAISQRQEISLSYLEQADRLEKEAVQRAKVEDMSEKDVSKAIKQLEKQMMEHAKNLDFEKAAQVRDQLQMLKAQAFGAPGTDNVVVLKA